MKSASVAKLSSMYITEELYVHNQFCLYYYILASCQLKSLFVEVV